MIARKFQMTIPYILLTVLTLPIIIMYSWLIISTFSLRTYGIKPEGFTLQNWSFLWQGLPGKPSIWQVTLNTFALAFALTLFVVFVSSCAGYALSRLRFSGRKTFLSMTIILHSFPSVTLLIATFYILRFLKLYDTLLGVALVMVSLQLPLGIWLMKGFFDNIPWDIEMSALIDGCSRFRTWWQVILPLIKPGIAALSIFSFISGWNEFLIPYTFITSPAKGTIAVYLQHLIGDTELVNYNVLAAVGLYQLLPVLLFFIFSQEYLLRIYTGGRKGGI
jgi:inositol-phosphate transport system permease protein